MKNVIVIGAGASGMTAALSAARHGAKVILLEKNRKPGSKLALTGNGRCNLTNVDMDINHFHGGDKGFVLEVLEGFGVSDTLDFFEGLGVALRERDGRIYPFNNRAQTVVRALREELSRLGVKTVYNTPAGLVYKESKDEGECGGKSMFYVRTDGWTYQADAVIVAAGSMAAPATGSTGDGYRIASDFGHTVVRPHPALVPLICGEKFFKKLAGVRLFAEVSVHSDGVFLAKDEGEVQFNADGISGIPVFQVSRFAVGALLEGKKVTASLNLLPRDFIFGTGAGDNNRTLESFVSSAGDRRLKALLCGLLPEKMAECILSRCGLGSAASAGDLSGAKLRNFCEMVENFEVTVIDSAGFAAAQVCAGGVSTAEIDPRTMESRYIDGLYFAGETVDVDGDCGGYNLQWAYSSGYTAGRSAAVADV